MREHKCIHTTDQHFYKQATKLSLAQFITLLFSHISAEGVDNNRGRQERRSSLRPSCDAEFAKALKVFYHSMTSVRGQLQRLRRHKPSVSMQVPFYQSCQSASVVQLFYIIINVKEFIQVPAKVFWGVQALTVYVQSIDTLCVCVSIGGSRPVGFQTVCG